MKAVTVSWDRFLKVERQAKEALRLALNHDPDIVKKINVLSKEIQRLTNHVNRELGVAQKVPLHRRIKIKAK